jgi:hypothetical protein
MLAVLFTIIVSAPIVGYCTMLLEGSSAKAIPGLIIFTYIFAIPVILIYGLPVSILSDKLNNRFIGIKRSIYSLLVHLTFGIIFVYLLMIIDSRFYLTEFNDIDLYVLTGSIIISVAFWLMDETIRKYFSINSL